MQSTNYLKTNNPIEASKLINKVRLQNKNKWYYIELYFNDSTYSIKAFNTWMQIFSNGKSNYSNCMDEKITEFKNHITKVLSY